MKHSTLGYTLAALTIFFALIAGCTSNPRVGFVNTQDTFNATVQVLLDNREAIGEEKWQEEILPLINAGDRSLDLYDALTQANQPTASVLVTLGEIVVQLQTFLE